jgi:Ni/Co efflux regulator RcnB
MKKLMTAMLALSFLGATAMIAQVPAATPDKTTSAKTTKSKKATTEKKAPTEKKDTTAKKAPKKAKKDTTN